MSDSQPTMHETQERVLHLTREHMGPGWRELLSVEADKLLKTLPNAGHGLEWTRTNVSNTKITPAGVEITVTFAKVPVLGV